MQEEKNLLEVKDLAIRYVTSEDGICRAVNGVSFWVRQGETLGLIGETGAGKTTIAKGIMGLIPHPPGEIVSGEIYFEGENLLKKNEKEMQKVRGAEISMIFQDPMTALNPIDTVGAQIMEAIRLHQKISRKEAVKKAVDMMEMVGIPGERFGEYPHQFSGGMKQRIVIAIALSCTPKLLIADEPTTALDVTIQAQVLSMMNHLKRELQTSMIMITHDLGVVAQMCDRVAILYAGEIVEMGTAAQIYDETAHPYTQGLFQSLPSMAKNRKRLKPMKGMMPDPTNLGEGCKFADRCPYAEELCRKEDIPLRDKGEEHLVRCRRSHEIESGHHYVELEVRRRKGWHLC